MQSVSDRLGNVGEDGGPLAIVVVVVNRSVEVFRVVLDVDDALGAHDAVDDVIVVVVVAV